MIYKKGCFLLKTLLFLCLFPLSIYAGKPPQLTPQETKYKIQEILKAHVCHQQLTPDLFKRALLNYIDELDPSKTYFLEAEIASWLQLSDQPLQEALDAYNKDILQPFKTIHGTMVSAIARRSAIEKTLINVPAAQTKDSLNFKELPWATSELELKERLGLIRSLQLKAAAKLDSEHTQTQFIQRLNKRRVSREKEIVGDSAKEQEQIILSFILKAVSSSLDSQTLYFTPVEANQFMIQVQQRLFGIGAQLRDDLDGFTVTKIVEGSPAAQSNTLKVGDKIIAVNQEMVVGMEITEAVSLVRGPQGSQVELTVLRDIKEGDVSKEEKLAVTLIRGEIVLQESRLETSFEPYADGIIATLHLHSFYQDNHTSSAEDLAAAIDKLKQEHSLKGIILDLRENGGGLLPQAVAVSGLFLSKGIVVSIKDNTQQVQHLRHLDNRKVWDGPLIVLTSRKRVSSRNCRPNASRLWQSSCCRRCRDLWQGNLSNVYFRIQPLWESQSQRGI
jgi:carboxyl-terminal processing protease